MKNVCYLFWFFLEKNVSSFLYKDFLSFLYIHVHKIYKKILDKYIYIYIYLYIYIHKIYDGDKNSICYYN